MSLLTKALANRQVPIDALSRPVAYHRVFRNIAGSVGAAVMLSQFWYWNLDNSDGVSRIPEDRDGWFYKTAKDITEETGMSRSEIETARKRLVSLGLIEEERRGLPAKMWFRLNIEKLVDLINREYGDTNNNAGNRQTTVPETRNQQGRFPANNNSESQQTITETTPRDDEQRQRTENVPSASPQRLLEQLVAEWFEEFWKTYPRNRRVKKPVALRAYQKVVKNEADAQRVLAGLEMWIQCYDWIKNDGQYVPHPSTFLNGHQFNDNPPVRASRPWERKTSRGATPDELVAEANRLKQARGAR